MDKYIIFGLLSLLIIIVSIRTLFVVKSHGFYRFISWECIAWLLASNYKSWFSDPLCIEQIISCIFLTISGYLIITGVLEMKKSGKSDKRRDESNLFKFEQTTELVNTGIFKYIRHPLYSSLFFLTWGILLKNLNIELFIVACGSAVSLYITAIMDEKECINYFGDSYKDYMKSSKRFIPFLF